MAKEMAKFRGKMLQKWKKKQTPNPAIYHLFLLSPKISWQYVLGGEKVLHVWLLPFKTDL